MQTSGIIANLALIALRLSAFNGIIGPTEAADCSTVTCDNGGTCNNFTVSPACLCPLPYIAPNCSNAADYCYTLQPDKGITALPVCLNGGNCTLTYTDPYFNCSCPDSHTGFRCDEMVTTTVTTTAPSTAEPGLTDGETAAIVVCAVIAAAAVVIVILIVTKVIPVPCGGSSSVGPAKS
ncbi:hypothetical protein BOX15_Mlig024659g1 [Macrostomum lignano]|uniref:EGF-like domain-containing protein n=1 Tax=Macrostomum lignano TaxID=282301 RepID=A0A267H8F3_9PLAT|nr:hypothetical protein BOX15_Mlig024659g1 [Macrostomum lignano]